MNLMVIQIVVGILGTGSKTRKRDSENWKTKE